MKHLFLYTILLLSLSSCKKDWLQVIPFKQRVATTVSDYDLLMNDPGLYLYQYSGGWQEPVFMGDEIAAEATYFINRSTFGLPLFQWKDSIYTLASQNPSILYLHNSQLYQLNKVINEVMEATDGTEAQKKEIRAQALATRAWSYFTMVNYYCKPYNASTAATDLGFPIVTTADVTNNSFPRGTLQQAYDFMIQDYKDALASIQDRPAIVTRMSRPAVEGLLGKLYLFMGRYNDALPLLKDAIAHVTANGQTSFYNYNQTFATGGSFLPIDANSGPTSPGQIVTDVKEAVVSKIFNVGQYTQYSNSGLVLSPQTAALYGASDHRLKFYTTRNPDFTQNAGGRLRKYGVQYARFGLQLADLYLLSAECKARLNDLTGAQADLLTVRKNRMPEVDAAIPTAVAADQNALIKFIIDERIREFALEGYRWFDMRRLSVDPLFAGISFTHTMYNADGTTTVYTLQQPNRLTMMLPRNMTEANPDMKNNP